MHFSQIDLDNLCETFEKLFMYSITKIYCANHIK